MSPEPHPEHTDRNAGFKYAFVNFSNSFSFSKWLCTVQLFCHQPTNMNFMYIRIIKRGNPSLLFLVPHFFFHLFSSSLLFQLVCSSLSLCKQAVVLHNRLYNNASWAAMSNALDPTASHHSVNNHPTDLSFIVIYGIHHTAKLKRVIKIISCLCGLRNVLSGSCML